MGALIGFMVKDLNLPASLFSYWGNSSPLIILLSMVFCVFWYTRIKPLVIVTATSLLIFWMLVAFSPLARWSTTGLTRQDVPVKSDAVFILASSLQIDGELTAMSMTRLLKALQVISQGLTERIIVSELPKPHASYAKATQKLLDNFRLNVELHSVGPIRNTYEEAVAVAKLFKEKKWQKLILVTTALHSRRAAAVFESQGLEVYSIPATETRFDLTNLNGSDERIIAFGTAIHEILGFRVYQYRGWIRAG